MQLVETDPDTVGSVGLLEDKCSLALTQMLRTFFVTLLYILVIIIFFSWSSTADVCQLQFSEAASLSMYIDRTEIHSDICSSVMEFRLADFFSENIIVGPHGVPDPPSLAQMTFTQCTSMSELKIDPGAPPSGQI